jgi:hypothetical protein
MRIQRPPGLGPVGLIVATQTHRTAAGSNPVNGYERYLHHDPDYQQRDEEIEHAAERRRRCEIRGQFMEEPRRSGYEECWGEDKTVISKPVGSERLQMELDFEKSA